MRTHDQEIRERVEFVRQALKDARATGIVYGNSGGKDSALVGILCKMACEDTLGLIMPCGSRRNYQEDKDDARRVSKQFQIQTRVVDLSVAKDQLVTAITHSTPVSAEAMSNIAPRLRMTTLYAVAASENRLVAGTGNRSEGYMGYFTKWGDGAYDLNPIADLTVTEIYELLRYLNAPASIIEKAPSAGLFDGQTDEAQMGVSYGSIDQYLLYGKANEEEKAIIEKFHKGTEHKRHMPRTFEGGPES